MAPEKSYTITAIPDGGYSVTQWRGTGFEREYVFVATTMDEAWEYVKRKLGEYRE